MNHEIISKYWLSPKGILCLKENPKRAYVKQENVGCFNFLYEENKVNVVLKSMDEQMGAG